MGIMNGKNNNPFNRQLSVEDNYDKLERYYKNSEVYDAITNYAYQNNLWVESMKPLRNPVHRSVEFFAAKLLPGNVKITAKNDSVKNAIEQFHKWSNFDSQKTVSSRQLALWGDLFWKITATDKVYIDTIKPKYVTKFESDNRGYLTFIRLDIPQVDENNRKYTYVEVWDKNNNYYAVWITYAGAKQKLETLGEPVEFDFLTALGIDFIPFIHLKFSDMGDERGYSCVSHAMEKIDEANRQTTRLHEILFRNNKSFWIVNSNKVDPKTGKFQPAPLFNSDNAILRDNDILYMPGLSTIASQVPNLNYADALAILKDMMDEIASDLPEIRYFDLKDGTSGKALRLLLGSAIDRANEARSNVLAGLVRADEMALTIGQSMGFFSGLGSYQDGSFEHKIDVDEIIPLDLDEKANTLKSFVDAGLPLALAMKQLDFSEQEIGEAVSVKAEQDAINQQNFMNTFNRL